MRTHWSENRRAWLGAGVLLGLVVSFYWPREQALAETVDRSDKIAMVTVNTQVGETDAVFLLDFVTGRLIGKAFNTQSGFNQTYFANLASDFQVGADAEYTIVSGRASLPAGAAPLASGCIYVAELNSGKVIMYGFPYANGLGMHPPRELVRVDGFKFRD